MTDMEHRAGDPSNSAAGSESGVDASLSISPGSPGSAGTGSVPGSQAGGGAPTDGARGVRPPGFRLPATTRVGRVRLQIADLERSVTYYRSVLGLRELDRSETGAVLGGPDGEPLVELSERKGVSSVPRHGRLGLYHFAILLPDRAALGRLVAHLSAIGERFGASDHLVSEALYLQDPDGLGIEVYADRPRSTWRHERDQLALDSRALDLGDLVRAAAGAEWTGVPSGTRMGHVHLHVGDLDRAAEFYHAGLGFDKIVWSYPGALFLSAGGYHHHLGLNTWAAGAAPAGENDARLLDWELIIPDPASLASARRSLSDRYPTVETMENGDEVARDSWGTAVRLVGG